eukprot:TRINITY_DN2659_c0_g2_i1.p1 TRINITY_DN2659_c0_g2~~TRINITY_DN2659_c0_g2_i1.p1  ORF type:complete len:120 (+),score=38.58 TRINITY_DN2659_c0_g2_i1:77-436(+)
MADLICFDAEGSSPVAAATHAHDDGRAVIESFDPLAGDSSDNDRNVAAPSTVVDLPPSVAAAFAGATAVTSADKTDKDRSACGLSPEEELALKQKIQEDAERLHEQTGGKTIDDPFAGL